MKCDTAARDVERFGPDLAAARRGDGEAAGRLVEGLRGYLFAVGRRAGLRAGDFEAALSDAVLRMLPGFARVKSPAGLRSWAAVVFRREMAARARFEAPRSHLWRGGDLSRVAVAEPVPVSESTRAEVEALLQRLTRGQRAIVLAHYFEGRTVAEIAVSRRMERNAVKVALRRALARLRAVGAEARAVKS